MIKGILLDLDGTVYLEDKEVPGALEFVKWLEEKDVPYLFVTNRANRTPEEVSEHLRSYGISCEPDHVLTSGQATAEYLGKGTVFCVGEAGLYQALTEAGLTITDDAPDYVVVSYDRSFTYDKLKNACVLIHGGAQFIATNPDKALKIEGGISPGTGAIVAAVAAGSGREPMVIGKPGRLIFDIALRRLGLAKEDVIAVGDNLDTDIAAGVNADIRTALILTGISTREDAARAPAKPTWVVADYAELRNVIEAEIDEV